MTSEKQPTPEETKVNDLNEITEEAFDNMTEDEKFMFIAKRILREHKAAFEELAK